tara:strand:- start:1014 stop:1190 length:177 start_codon:yes stop_codon:yes gene_type:complete
MRQAAVLLAAAGEALGLAPGTYPDAWLRVASIAKRRSTGIVVRTTVIRVSSCRFIKKL